MNINLSLWKVPDNFKSKYDFPELVILSNILKDEKEMIHKTDESLSVIEKSYKKLSGTLLTIQPHSFKYIENLHEANIYKQFVISHNDLAKKYSNFATKLSILKNRKMSTLKETYKSKAKVFSAEISKMKNILSESFEALVNIRNSLDKYTKELQRLITSRKLTTQESQQIPKFINAINGKIVNIDNAYTNYRLKFIEYCKYREHLFSQIDIFLKESNSELQNILNEATEIDKELFDAKEKEQVKELLIINHDLFKEELPTEKKNFRVTVEMTLMVEGGQTLTSDNIYTVIEAKGDNWKIKSIENEVFVVPSEYLVPILT